MATCDIGPIDAVYTWVNGSDPNFIRSLILERIKYSENDTTEQPDLNGILKKFSYEEICLKGNYSSVNYESFKWKDTYYAASNFVYFECLQEVVEQSSNNNFYNCSSIRSLQELFQSINVKILSLSSSGRNIDTLPLKQRFLLYPATNNGTTILPSLGMKIFFSCRIIYYSNS